MVQSLSLGPSKTVRLRNSLCSLELKGRYSLFKAPISVVAGGYDVISLLIFWELKGLFFSEPLMMLYVELCLLTLVCSEVLVKAAYLC